MFRALQAWNSRPARAASPSLAVGLAVLASLPSCWPAAREWATWARARRPARRRRPRPNIGTGKVKVGLILPLSATGNAAVAAQSMRNAAEMALAEFNNPDLQLLVKDDGGTAAGRPAGGAAGARRGRRDHPGAAVRAHRRSGRAGRARPQRSGDRVLDRCQRGRARRLSPELPPGVRRRAHHRLCRQPGPPLVRRADSGQRLWQRGRGRLQAGGGAPRRARRRARALSRGQGEDAGAGQDRGAGGDGGEPGGRDLHSGRRRRRAGGGADPDRQRRRSQTRATPGHRPVGGWADLLQSARSTAPGMPAPTRPASATSPAAIAAATARIPCAPPRSPTTRSRWWPPW